MTDEEKTSALSVKDVLNKRLLVLVMKTVYKSPEVEFLHFSTQIINMAIAHKDLRDVILTEVLKQNDQSDEHPYNYAHFLKC